MYVHIDRFTFLITYHSASYWISSQVVNVVVVGPVQLFLFRNFQVGVYFVLVCCALLSPCVFADYLLAPESVIYGPRFHYPFQLLGALR